MKSLFCKNLFWWKKGRRESISEIKIKDPGTPFKKLPLIYDTRNAAGETNWSRIRAQIVDHLMRVILVIRSFYEYFAVGGA